MEDLSAKLLASLAIRLARENGVTGGEALGLYCILDICQHDDQVARLVLGSTSLSQTFENQIRPTRVLQQMPVAQAFWCAQSVDARGPVRVFCRTKSAAETAVEQATLDLQEGLCDVAMILNVQLDPEKTSGKVLWAER